MSFVKTKDGVEIYYKDWGKGQPIVFSHGWPLSADDWDNQMLFFLKQGYRVIAHDRRGHGASRSEERHSDRPLDRRRRSGALSGAAQRQELRQGCDHFGGAATDGE